MSNDIAQSMDAYLNSAEFNFLFKKADLLDDKVEELTKDEDLDVSMEDKELMSDESFEDEAEKMDLDEEMSEYDLNTNLAVDGLLTASAALDEIGAEEASTAVLKLASLVSQAKKKKMDDKKKEKEDKAKAKDKKDKNEAKDKEMKKKEKEKEMKKKEKEKEEKEKAKAKAKKK
ncbi:MAG: hypothetical protein LC122_12955 [Chitinophagales bacterium]|nr:hypothetical protein [Chitinophagales bacterium]